MTLARLPRRPAQLFAATLPAALGFASGKDHKPRPGARCGAKRAPTGVKAMWSTSRFAFRRHPNIRIAQRRNQMSTAQETSNKATFSRFQDAMNTGDAEVISKRIDELVEPDVLFHTPLPIEAMGA
jgi:hypothetical protein